MTVDGDVCGTPLLLLLSWDACAAKMIADGDGCWINADSYLAELGGVTKGDLMHD